MEAIKNFARTLELMKDKHIVYFLSPYPNYCVIKEEHVEIINHQIRYVLSFKDFIDLFSHETFYVHDRKETMEIDPLKDDDYYGKRYQ